MAYAVTYEERTSGKLAEDKRRQIAEDIDSTGYAVVTDLIPAETCEILIRSVLEDVEQVGALQRELFEEAQIVRQIDDQ